MTRLQWVTCPRCEGIGDDPSFEDTMDEDIPITCTLCDGSMLVLERTAANYLEEKEDT